jgi:RTC4-like domain
MLDSKLHILSYCRYSFVESYGPMGVMIINSTLGRMFNHGSGAFDELGSTLATLTSLKTTDVSESDPEFMFWESVDASSVSPKDFLDYVVQPFVATLLISQDLKVGEKEAEETRITSKQYGITFNSNTDDGRMDDITMKNMMLGRKENLKVHFILFTVSWMDELTLM